MVVVNRWQNAEVWRNGTEGAGNWIALRPRQDGLNRDAVGAWIEVKFGDTVLRRERPVGGGHVSGDLGWVHFGIGAAEEVEVRVLWPDGTEGAWQKIGANGFHIVTAAGAEIFQPAR